jgi:CRISPR-associated protein Csb1
VQADKDTEGEDKKEAKKDQQQSVYNLDDLRDNRNVVDIDSPQSDGNRTEPLFKSKAMKHLVPQVVIDVNGTPVNILDAGHRAGDAVVRLSSLAAEFHTAFERADQGDHSALASLAPTSLLYGAWDSRSTQTKLQRIIKASVRAENVRPLTRSATFIPAVDYVSAGAVKEELDVGEGDSNPLSSEGMKHAIASQTLGGVRLTDPSKLIRTIKINLVALRQLRAIVTSPKPDDKAADGEKNAHEAVCEEELQEKSAERTQALKEYILALAMVVATSDPELNLREGCNLRIANDQFFLVRHRKDDELIDLDKTQVQTFASNRAEAFFEAMGIDFDKKDHLDAKFEKDVAEEFLGLVDAKGKLSGTERDKVRKIGPATRATLDEYWRQRRKRERAGDPIEKLRGLIEKVRTKNRGKELNADADKLRSYLDDNPADTDELKTIYENIRAVLDGKDSAEAKTGALKTILPAVGTTIDTAARPNDKSEEVQ